MYLMNIIVDVHISIIYSIIRRWSQNVKLDSKYQEWVVPLSICFTSEDTNLKTTNYFAHFLL